MNRVFRFEEYLLRGYGPGEVRDDPPEQPVVGRQAQEELELVVLSQSSAGRLDLCYQLRVHPGGMKKRLKCWAVLLRRQMFE